MEKFLCAAREDWDEYARKVDAMHSSLAELQEASKQWEHLRCLPEIRDKLVDAAITKDHRLPILLAKILGSVIFALALVIVFLLTGQHLGWFGLHQ